MCAVGVCQARLSRTLLGTASWERRVFQTRASRPHGGEAPGAGGLDSEAARGAGRVGR